MACSCPPCCQSLGLVLLLVLAAAGGVAAAAEEASLSPPARWLGPRAPDHPEAQAWLEAYHRQPQPAAEQPEEPQAERERRLACSARRARGDGASSGSSSSGSWGGNGLLRSFLRGASKLAPQPAQQRRPRGLVLAPVGPAWNASATWLDSPEEAEFDVVVIFYGADAASFSCPRCKEVHALRGAPWRLYHTFTQRPEWPDLASGYDYVWLPDDDLRIGTRDINRFFSIMREFGLLISQPAVCRDTPEQASSTWKPDLLHQRDEFCLRYTTWVEIMGIGYNMSFFKSVVAHALGDSYIGWGMDSLMPALLRFPPRGVVIVDRVCMVHPPSPEWASAAGKEDSVYRPGLAPYSPHEEERIVFAKYNYNGQTLGELGRGWMCMDTLGSVPNPDLESSSSSSGGGSGGSGTGYHYGYGAGWAAPGLLAPALAAVAGALLLASSLAWRHRRAAKARLLIPVAGA